MACAPLIEFIQINLICFILCSFEKAQPKPQLKSVAPNIVQSPPIQQQKPQPQQQQVQILHQQSQPIYKNSYECCDAIVAVAAFLQMTFLMF